MLDYGGGALQAIVYLNNNVTLIKNVSLRKREGNIIFIANGGTKKNICHVFSVVITCISTTKETSRTQTKQGK